MLVIGSRNSSNSNRLVEVAREHGADSYLIDNEAQVQEEWLEGKRVVGITSGASAPEELVQRLVDFFRDRGTDDVRELEVVQEDVRFMLPKVIRQAMPPAPPPPERSPAGDALRTLVVSDLHLGSQAKRDVLRAPDLRGPLLQAAASCRRLVLLGDVLELRHGPQRDALAVAREPLTELGAALPPGSEVVIVPGNHDHHLLAAWFERRARKGHRRRSGSRAPWTGGGESRWPSSRAGWPRPRSA